MKQKIKIFTDDEVIYKGKIINFKIKESAIIEKSVELFDDDEPCIIHQSYVYKEYANYLVELFKETGKKTLSVCDYKEELSFLDYPNLDAIKIKLL